MFNAMNKIRDIRKQILNSNVINDNVMLYMINVSANPVDNNIYINRRNAKPILNINADYVNSIDDQQLYNAIVSAILNDLNRNDINTKTNNIDKDINKGIDGDITLDDLKELIVKHCQSTEMLMQMIKSYSKNVVKSNDYQRYISWLQFINTLPVDWKAFALKQLKQ
jgi:hypothetical protein